MSYRVILIENGATLNCKLDNLLACVNSKEIWIPFSDISMIVIDNLRTTITTRTLNELSKKNISLVTCDEKHLPNGLYLSQHQHSRTSKMISYQLKFDKDSMDKLWKEVVSSKILNQIQVMERLDCTKETEKLHNYLEDIKDGDPSNREAHAAKVYFNTIMGNTHSRGNKELLINSGLDYGYSIIRSYLARLCCGHGLETSIGFHHKSEYNAFNLVDDLIEPIRPIVDYHAKNILDKDELFNSSHRESLINLLNHKIKISGNELYMSNALEKYVSSYVDCIKHHSCHNLIIPEFNNYIGIDI